MRDGDVRWAVRQMLHQEHAGDNNTRIVEEMGLWSGAVRIDVAVINGEMSGYELKSDRDTLDRLPAQAKLYSRVFDRLNLVVGSRHAKKAVGLVPEWWGVIVATQAGEDIGMSAIRRGCSNPDPDPYLIAQLLWKSECLELLTANNLAKGWRSKPVVDLHKRLAEALPLNELKDQARSALKRRIQWLGQPVSN